MAINESWLLTIVTFLPLVGAVIIGVSPARWARILALATALAAWVVSLIIAAGFNAAGAGFQFVQEYDWISIFGIEYKLGVDGLSMALVVLTTTLTWISILASFSPIQTRIKEYMISFLILEVGMLGVFLALDTFLFYIFWEIVLVPMYLIIGIWGGQNRIYATIKFVLYTLVGSLLMLVAILATAFAYQAAHGGVWAGAFDYESLRAYAGPAGFAYGLIRFCVSFYPDAAHTYAPLIIVLSLIGIIYGAIVAMVQPDLKKLIAYSSVSHMGFVTLGIFAFQEQALDGAILQMINHGLITGALFLLVGVIYERTHDRTIAKMGGLAALTPVWAVTFGFFVFASVGLPGLSGFVGEFLTLVGTFQVSPAAAAVATSVMIFAAGYLLWMYQRVVLTEPSAFLLGLKHHLSDMTATEVLTIAPLGAIVVVFGLFPGVLLDLVREPVAVTLHDAAGGAPIGLDPLVPVVGIGLLVAVIAARLLALRPGRPTDAEAGSSLTPTEGAA
jgi:NADH-quinone oxidoreductase subunit M